MAELGCELKLASELVLLKTPTSHLTLSSYGMVLYQILFFSSPSLSQSYTSSMKPIRIISLTYNKQKGL